MRILTLILFSLVLLEARTQPTEIREIRLTVTTGDKVVLPSASVALLQKDSTVYRQTVTDANGSAVFENLPLGAYLIRVSSSGYSTKVTRLIDVSKTPTTTETINMEPVAGILGNVVVTSKKPFVQFFPDKTVINVEASINNAGTSIMDVLEKSPGITIGRDGTIIMKGKPQVMVLIDGKQTQLTGTELQAYLSGINSSQVDVIELIDNPGAKYDAAGNAGIINIRTKKIKQRGFNGNLSLSVGQGFFPKTNNSINMNYRNGKVNVYMNYGMRASKERMQFEALRKYFDVNGNDSILLQQPNVTKQDIIAHNVKVGIDFFASNKTTLGISFTGLLNTRDVNSFSTIDWMSPAYVIDSSIITQGTRHIEFKRAGVNLNGQHTFKNGSELSADVDIIGFNIKGDQNFQTQLNAPGSVVQITRGDIPSSLDIITAKLDYSKRFKRVLWESGVKTASTKTDNLAQYYFYDGNTWIDDLSRSNHFLYDEKIHSVYSSVDAEMGKWHWQGGLRYEVTSYKANQLGNSVVKDSSFKNNYASLFPSAFVMYKLDSNNSFTLRFGRRIDRPQFQNLNPFLITLNKYTYEGGNPFIRPQYTWNIELQHTFKQILSTSISYNYLKDYFSQIFVIDSNNSNVNKNIIIYTRGNVGRFQNIGASVTLQLPVKKWWNLTSSVIFNHKIIEGVVWEPIRASISQVNISLSNQFQFGKGWGFELGGYYLSNSQIDLQEWLTPQGELGAGVSKQILKGKGTLRLTIRDMFYTQNYSGYSRFQNSDEPFEVRWDSRVTRLSFSWRFGKPMKPVKRSGGGATEETDRVGSGN